jgi:hypothetical protein
MSSGNDAQLLADRLNRLDERCRQLGRRCRFLGLGLALATLLALVTPTALLFRTSFGSELKIGTVAADRLVLPRRGQLVIEGDTPGQPSTLLGYQDGDVGLTFFDDTKATSWLIRPKCPKVACRLRTSIE